MNTITSAPTLAHVTGLAERQAKAATAAHDVAAVAMAELCRQAKGALYNAVAASRHGIVEEEAAAVIDSAELARALLAALVQDGEVEHRQGVYRLPRGAA